MWCSCSEVLGASPSCFWWFPLQEGFPCSACSGTLPWAQPGCDSQDCRVLGAGGCRAKGQGATTGLGAAPTSELLTLHGFWRHTQPKE